MKGDFQFFQRNKEVGIGKVGSGQSFGRGLDVGQDNMPPSPLPPRPNGGLLLRLRAKRPKPAGYKMSPAVPFLPMSPALEGIPGEEAGSSESATRTPPRFESPHGVFGGLPKRRLFGFSRDASRGRDPPMSRTHSVVYLSTGNSFLAACWLVCTSTSKNVISISISK